MLTPIIYIIAGILILFVLAGVLALGSSLIRSRRSQPPGHGETRQRNTGRVEPRHALLNAPARIGVEFVSALFGFPGLGWLVSGKVVTGLVLLIGGFSLIWGAFPLYLIVSGEIIGDPYRTIQYLPLVAVASAAGLSVHHVRLKRSGQGRQVDALS